MGVDGTYEITMQTPMGEFRSKLSLRTSGGALSGMHETPMGTINFAGTVRDNEVEWVENVRSPMGSISVTFKGKVEGDRISGQATAPFGSIPFEGSRVKV
ncbi:MAG: hypothetical protein RMJ15_02690 [Nitrososphaerota archaeon]|nr:hypothetical protein [Candidatus Bathyarchaeota archaeon]MDW8022638.1 hypothetical protein [Nitrososphaerota archaeon]